MYKKVLIDSVFFYIKLFTLLVYIAASAAGVAVAFGGEQVVQI